jgi:hypothetical protein
MAYDVFKPEIWSEMIERKLEKSLVFGALANRDYEGNIARMGDTVHIQTVGATTVNDYTGADITFESPTGATQAITIDKAKYFGLTFDAVDKAQAEPELMEKQINDALYRIADSMDQSLAALESKVAAANRVAVDVVANESVIDGLTKLSRVLNESNVPRQGRWVVVSPAVEESILKELDNTALPQTADSAMINGYVGRLRGFEIFVSNNVVVAADIHKCIGGISKGMTLASQLSELDAGKHEKKFGEYVKGLELYGCDVLETETGFTEYLAALDVSFAVA